MARKIEIPRGYFGSPEDDRQQQIASDLADKMDGRKSPSLVFEQPEASNVYYLFDL